jgi:hypothetical protein
MVKKFLFLLVVALSALSVSAQSVSSISVKNVNGTLGLKKKNMQALQIEVLPSDAANKAVSYSVDNSATATVSKSGEITGVSAGTAVVTITAQDGSNVSATLPVTVTDRTPELAANHPDGPYIMYSATEDKVVSVDVEGYIIEKVYPQLPTNYTFTVLSDVNEGGKTTRSAFAVTIHPLSRPSVVRPAPDSLIVLSDVHAKWKEFASILKAQKVVDDNLNWSFGNNELMINGDVFDRGDDATTCLWLIYKLQQQARDAGGQVYFLFGNHEEMVLRNNFNYTNAKYPALASKYFETPPDSSQYGSRFFNADTELGRWFRDACSGIQVIGKDIFVHAGFSVKFYSDSYDLETMNTIMANDIIKTGGRHPFFFSSNSSGDTGSPLWARGMMRGTKDTVITPQLPFETLKNILVRYGVERVVIGHTEVQSSSNLIVSNDPMSYSYYDYRMLNVNVPTATAFNRHGRGALVLKNGDTWCIYDNKANTPIALPEGSLSP